MRSNFSALQRKKIQTPSAEVNHPSSSDSFSLYDKPTTDKAAIQQPTTNSKFANFELDFDDSFFDDITPEELKSPAKIHESSFSNDKKNSDVNPSDIGQKSDVGQTLNVENQIQAGYRRYKPILKKFTKYEDSVGGETLCTNFNKTNETMSFQDNHFGRDPNLEISPRGQKSNSGNTLVDYKVSIHQHFTWAFFVLVLFAAFL